MKLFLCSMVLMPKHYSAFEKLVGKKLSDIKIVIMEDAADGEGRDTSWVLEIRDHIAKSGVSIEPLKLKEYIGRESELLNELNKYDVLYFGGGNTYYLRWIMHKVGLDENLKTLLDDGKVYAGASAGAIVAGPTLKYVDESGCDESNVIEDPIFEGLNFVDTVVIPHWGRDDFGPAVTKLNELLISESIKTECITDEQAVVVDGDSWSVIP